MSQETIVNQFCTPPYLEETEFDKKAFASAETMDVEFENRILKGYSMGTGQSVLLVHGWNSRASHLALLARSLVKKGFRVVAFDGPAHGYSRRGPEDMSNLFEFSRAVSCVAGKIDNLYSVIGHSFGGMTAAFAMLGRGLLSEYQVEVEKLILISSPESLSGVIERYNQNRGESDIRKELTQGLEKTFDFTVSDYDLSSRIGLLNSEILIIHDEQDEEIPVSIALNLKEASKKARLVLTKGAGHKKILISRDMLRSVNEFLLA
ncbi:MAG: alpha/beta fold hydrolase [Leptospirales bacterium]